MPINTVIEGPSPASSAMEPANYAGGPGMTNKILYDAVIRTQKFDLPNPWPLHRRNQNGRRSELS
ncbi:MAG: hypothetical protein ACREPU_12600 [Rhodanobacteraceae bacterium]